MLRLAPLPFLAFLALLAAGCGDTARRHRGAWFARWTEAPVSDGASRLAPPEDRTGFRRIASHDPEDSEECRAAALAALAEGDLVAFRMTQWEAELSIASGNLQHLGYRLYRYGHLAILVAAPGRSGGLALFSSEAMRGSNADEGLEGLPARRWDAWRLEHPERLDRPRLREYARLAEGRAVGISGYAYLGFLGFWHGQLAPSLPEEVDADYTCATTVLAALHFAGVALDCGDRVGDIITPWQVVASRGRFVEPPALRLGRAQGPGASPSP